MQEQFNWPEGLPLPNPGIRELLVRIQVAYDKLHTMGDDRPEMRPILQKELCEQISDMAKTSANSLPDLIAKLAAILHITPLSIFEDIIAHSSVNRSGDQQTLIASVFFDLFNGVKGFPRVPR